MKVLKMLTETGSDKIAGRAGEVCKQLGHGFVMRNDKVRIQWPFKWQVLLAVWFHSREAET